MTAPDVRTPSARRAHAENQNATIVTDGTCLDKWFATLDTQLALKGYSLYSLAGGGFLVAKWNRTAHCSDLCAVAQFLRLIGGAR